MAYLKSAILPAFNTFAMAHLPNIDWQNTDVVSHSIELILANPKYHIEARTTIHFTTLLNGEQHPFDITILLGYKASLGFGKKVLTTLKLATTWIRFDHADFKNNMLLIPDSSPWNYLEQAFPDITPLNIEKKISIHIAVTSLGLVISADHAYVEFDIA